MISNVVPKIWARTNSAMMTAGAMGFCGRGDGRALLLGERGVAVERGAGVFCGEGGGGEVWRQAAACER